MKYVYLNSQHNEFVVDDETYEQLAALVQTGKLCVQEWRNPHPYSLDNPCVGRKLCLHHLLMMQPQLTLVDSPGTNSDGQHCYRFADSHGYIWTSTEDESNEAIRNTLETMRYYGFTPPARIASRGKSTDFYSHYATLHGDLKASVIILTYNQYAEKIRGTYLLYKDGPCVELSKKSDVYKRADALVESTKDENGEYHVGGTAHTQKDEGDVFVVISQLESAVYDVTRKLQSGSNGGTGV